MTEDRGQRKDDRRQRTEGREKRTENRLQRVNNRGSLVAIRIMVRQVEEGFVKIDDNWRRRCGD
jgi:hypothetical protein